MLTRYGNSPYSPEQAGESLAGNSSDGEPSAPLNTNHTPAPSSVLGRTTAVSNRSRFGTMFGPLTEQHGEAVLTSFLGDFLVRTSVAPEKGQESPENEAAFGEKWRELFVKFDPVSSGWKTHQCLFQEALDWSSLTLPRWGMMRDGELWELPTPEHLTDGKESGLWPTPRCQMTRRPVEVRKGGDRGNLEEIVAIRMTYPTPTKHNSKECDAPSEANRNEPSLTHVARGGDKTLPTRLNPAWVEWLMGWPIYWTALNESETANAHKQWLSLGNS